MTACMLDIETLGTKPGCVVLSVGAVLFDYVSDSCAHFHRRISIGSCIAAGLTVDPETVAWWQRQSKAAQVELTGTDTLEDAALAFWKFVGSADLNEIWAQGADFDFPIWKAAMAAVGILPPWKFQQQRDTRTAYAICRFDQKSVDRDGAHHSAADDAWHQVRCLKAALATIRHEVA